MRICINAGHCYGVDPGAIGQKGTQEAYITKLIASHTRRYLQGHGYDVVSVSSKNLSEVCKTSNENNCDFFVSIHCNAAANKDARGTETFYWKSCEKGKKLAKAINDEIVATLGTRDRGIKENTTFYVIKHTKCTAVLVECEFISNLEGEKLLNEKTSIFAQAITRGIMKGTK